MKNCKFFKISIIIILIIIIFALYNTINKHKKNTEEFTPKIRETYRPYVRHARLISEGFYGDSKNNVNHLFRKLGLY
jgi:hypothetical protein